MCDSMTGDETGDGADGGSGDVESVPADLLFQILSDAERRHALRCLSVYENSMTLADLADEVARRKYRSQLAEIPADDVKRVYMRLYHTHVPKMEAANVVEYDQESDTVRTVQGLTGSFLDEIL